MKKLLREAPLYLILLPLFFFLHGYTENAGTMDLSGCLAMAGIYTGIAGGMGLLFYRVFGDIVRACLFATLLLGFNFFFGYLHDFSTRHLPFLKNYAVFLTVSVLVLVFLFFRLKKTKSNLAGSTIFLNIVLLAWLVFDSAVLTSKLRSPRSHLSVVGNSTRIPIENSVNLPTADARHPAPDIYFLLFDEYSSTRALKDWYGYENGGLDSFLLSEGFHIQGRSRSNYPSTIFSLASILNMSYLEGLKDPHACTIRDYADCSRLIENNAVARLLAPRNYEIRNYSIFDVADQPSLVNVWTLPVNAGYITHQTLVSKLWDDLGPGNLLHKTFEANNTLLAATKKSITENAEKPRFVYCHLLMPHSPFYYDSSDRLRTSKEMQELSRHPEKKQTYLGYIPHTNAVIRDLVNLIKKKSGGKAVIILMGDHGYRTDQLTDINHLHYFQNQNAIYFPDGDYRLLYDSLTGVNQFRVVFNKLFGADLPLLKDTTVFLTDKK